MLRKNLLLVTLLISAPTIWLIAPTSGPWSPTAPITSNLTNDDQPRLSGTGNRIAFISDMTAGPEVFSMRTDGTELKQLTSNQARECCPSITRDGTTIVFQSDLRGDEEIFLINADGTIPQSCAPNRIVQGTVCQLTDNREDDVTPVISPDGSKIAFASNRDGDLEIFIMNPDGSGVAQLTFNGASDENPSISGNGGLVAFDSNLGGDYEIFVVKSDGTGLRQLTNNFDIQERFPSVSEDGGKVVFEAAGPAIAIAPSLSPNMGGPAKGPTIVETSLIMIVNSDGTGLKLLTTNSADNRDASISGDGRLVAFVSTLDGDKEIFTVHSDGTMMTQITMNTAIDFSPRLNYTGEVLVYVSNLDGDFDIYSIVTPVSAGGGGRFYPL